MSNMLTIILVTSTLITGLFWFFYKIKWSIRYFFYKDDKTLKTNVLEKECKIFKCLSSFFPALLLVFFIRSFVYEPFQIPSGSMLPTLFVGDFILVEKFAYGIKDPIMHKTLIETNKPQIGDVAVFRNPIHPSVNYIKRVIGLPGDKIIYNVYSKHITIYKNYKNDNFYDKKIIFSYSDKSNNLFSEKICFLKTNILKTLPKRTVYNSKFFRIIEENMNNIKHNILLLGTSKNDQNKYFKQPGMPDCTWIVPKGQYFVMGDNRDNSLDSRYWGFVPESNLIGKATKIWMSISKTKSGWPIGIHFNRIGNIH